jgi:2,4-dienoyl-CoA reductase-like NADH-dependent reductase (Old Yellow Enzyme family)
MATLFETAAIGKMPLRNRLVRSATWEGMCTPDGRPTAKLIECYTALAKGAVGLIISGYTFVRPEGKQMPGQMGLQTPLFEPDYRTMARVVHDAGGALAVQLVHTGGHANTDLTGLEAVAPSVAGAAQYQQTPAELSKQQIGQIVTAFGRSAARAMQWGVDAVQLHGAHGYLISQFLSPHTNRRTDEYGGAIENRCRFMLEVLAEIRRTTGPDYPVMIKLNATDNREGGLDIADAVIAAEKLDNAGIDAIEISSGTPACGPMGPAREKIDGPEKEAYNLELAQQIKAKVSCPVMVVGGFRSHAVCNEAVSTHGLDFIALSRPLIRQPDLPNLWQKGEHQTAACISCNKCFVPGIRYGGIYCMAKRNKKNYQGRMAARRSI